jgi:signal transduction histidine kinase/CheY-like chemotaxis protein
VQAPEDSADRPGRLSEEDKLGEGRLIAQLRLLNRVAQAAARSLELPPILSVSLRELAWHLPRNACLVWLIEQDQAPDNVEAVAETPQPVVLRLADAGSDVDPRAAELALPADTRLGLADTPFTACLQGGEAVYSDWQQESERNNSLARTLAAHGANAAFAVPLRAGERSVGILQSVCMRSDGFTNEQIQLLYLVADLLGPAISNCQLFGRLRAAYDELRQTQGQLIHAEKMRALGELASGMAHDFNNSLCGVLGFLDLALADLGLPQSVRGYLESAHTSALDAAHTVRRVQNFARWQRSGHPTEVLDVNVLLRQTLELTRHKWESLSHALGAPIKVEVITEAQAKVTGSGAELREVITNLVFNAVDAMPQGGTLTVRTWSSQTDVCVSVQDTGVGMSEAVRQRIFEPFFTTKGERGNGLGLSVTFGIVKRCGGEVSVQSLPGRGTTFVVRLPVANAAADASLSGSAHVAGTDSQASNSRSLRILVIEDEENVRRFLFMALTQIGHRPRLASDGTEGLAAFEEEKFDLVLTDLGLPGVSGEEVARVVARRSPATPVVLLTGWSDQLRDEAKHLEGVARILGKPITLQTLAATLSQLCPQ